MISSPLSLFWRDSSESSQKLRKKVYRCAVLEAWWWCEGLITHFSNKSEGQRERRPFGGENSKEQPSHIRRTNRRGDTGSFRIWRWRGIKTKRQPQWVWGWFDAENEKEPDDDGRSENATHVACLGVNIIFLTAVLLGPRRRQPSGRQQNRYRV